MGVVEFVAPKRVYQVPLSSASQRREAGGYHLDIPLGLARTKTGSLGTWFQGHPFPRKTFIYAGITPPNNKAKRITLSLFLPFASLRHGLKDFLNSYLHNYNRLIDSIYADCDQIPYLHYQYYSEFGKALWDFIYLFLKKLGIKDEIAYRTGLQLVTMIEYDDVYRYSFVDIMNESVRDNLLKNPRKEILRLVEIYKQRSLIFATEDDMRSAGARIIGAMKTISLLMYIPWIKNAFKFAISNINYDYFIMDESDEYWLLNRGDYNSKGLPFEERKAEMLQKMMEFTEQINPGKKAKIVEENGIIKIVTN